MRTGVEEKGVVGRCGKREEEEGSGGGDGVSVVVWMEERGGKKTIENKRKGKKIKKMGGVGKEGREMKLFF